MQLIRGTPESMKQIQELHHNSAQPFITIPNLTLHGALWDLDKNILSVCDDTDNVSSVELFPESTEYRAVITVTLLTRYHGLQDTSHSTLNTGGVFQCPVIAASLGSEIKRELLPLFHIPLPCNTTELELFDSAKNVYLILT